MNIGNRMIFGNCSLPYDCEVEYIESTGAQAVVLDLPFEPGHTIEQKVQITVITDWGQIIVANGSSYCFVRRNASSANFQSCCNTAYSTIEWQMDSNPHILKFAFNSTSYSQHVDSILKGTRSSSGFPSGSNVYYSLFGRYSVLQHITSENSMHKLFWLTIHDASNALILDLVPVRKGRIGYLYDRISKRMYGDMMKTENFILGPDVR